MWRRIIRWAGCLLAAHDELREQPRTGGLRPLHYFYMLTGTSPGNLGVLGTLQGFARGLQHVHVGCICSLRVLGVCYLLGYTVLTRQIAVMA